MPGSASFDLDGTLLLKEPGQHGSHCDIFRVSNEFAEQNFIKKKDNRRIQAVARKYALGEYDDKPEEFVNDALRASARSLEGRSVEVAQKITKSLFEAEEPWRGFVDPTLSKLGKMGVKSSLVTAAPQFIANVVIDIKDLGRSFHSIFAETSDGLFRGDVLKVMNGERKSVYVLATLAIDGSGHSYAFGDSEGDIPMLEVVNSPKCIDPTPGLHSVAVDRGWTIVDNPDLPIALV